MVTDPVCDLRQSCDRVGMWLGELKVASLLFSDDVVFMPPSVQDLQLSLDWFAVECGWEEDQHIQI